MAAAQLEGNRRRRMRTVDDELFELLIRLMAVAEFEYNSAAFSSRPSPRSSEDAAG